MANALFGGQCDVANLIYKATVTLDGKHYIGRTQNDMKTQFFKHITGVSKVLIKV